MKDPGWVGRELRKGDQRKKAGSFLNPPKIPVKLENNYPFITLLRKKVQAKRPNPNKAMVATSESFAI